MMAYLYKVRLSLLAAASFFLSIISNLYQFICSKHSLEYGKTTNNKINLISLISFTILSVLQVYTF